MKISDIQKLTVSALLLATGLFLPFLTGQIPAIGNMLLPMHIPVLLCGLLCGFRYGLTVGFILPILRSYLFGMPPLYPTALSMAFEMAAYGSVSGHLFNQAKSVRLQTIYYSMISAMITGRIIWGIAQIILLEIKGNSFTFAAFSAGAFINAIPGIIIQLTLIPAIILALHKSDIISSEKKSLTTK